MNPVIHLFKIHWPGTMVPVSKAALSTCSSDHFYTSFPYFLTMSLYDPFFPTFIVLLPLNHFLHTYIFPSSLTDKDEHSSGEFGSLETVGKYTVKIFYSKYLSW